MKLGAAALAESLGPFATAVGAAFGSFTVKQSVSPLPIPRIAGGRLDVGSRIWIAAEGEFTCATGITWVLGFFLGTHDDSATAPTIVTDVGLSSVITSGTTPTAWPWRMDWHGKVTKTGASGSMIGSGTLDFGTALTTYSSTPVPITAALRTVAINTTVDNRVGVSATCGTSGAGNTITTYGIDCLILD